MEVRDSNGTFLQNGDSIVIKDLKVKGFSGGIKPGTMLKNISLTETSDEAGDREDKSHLV